MKNRLAQKIQEAKRANRKLFCAFLTLGYPDTRTTEKLIKGFEELGVDIVELGFPFSDPLADGPTIQFSSEAAIRRGVSIEDAFQVVSRLRKRGVSIPIIFFSYLNPIYHYGEKKFIQQLKRSGFDGLIVPDCPPEEEQPLWKECAHSGIASVFLATPTTTLGRARKIFARSKGFIYYVSVRGVTGERGKVPNDLTKNLKQLSCLSAKPILVGFGVSSPKQVKRIAAQADGVIVGSAIVNRIRQSNGKPGPVLSFVGSLVRSLSS